MHRAMLISVLGLCAALSACVQPGVYGGTTGRSLPQQNLTNESPDTIVAASEETDTVSTTEQAADEQTAAETEVNATTEAPETNAPELVDETVSEAVVADAGENTSSEASANETVNTEAEEVAVEPLIPEPDALIIGERLYKAGDLRAARSTLTEVLDLKDLNEKHEAKALELLGSINATIFTSDDAGGDMSTYTVKRGDSLSRIASRYGTTWELLRRVNELPNNTIRIGQKIKVPNGKLSVVVRKDQFVLDVLIDGDFIKRYEVSTGVGNSTPEGEFTIRNRIEKPQDGPYKFGDPRHRLGSHWLGLKGEEGYESYGIHGCRAEEESKIGSEASRGCVRLRNDEVADLFQILPVGTKVLIKA